MSGKTGRSGGRRPGAGRPPQSFTLRPKHALIIWERDEHGNPVGLSRGARITSITSTTLTLSLFDADNQPTGEITIRRFVS